MDGVLRRRKIREMDLKQRTEELKKEAREALREDKNRAEVFEAFVRSEGWKLYSKLVREKVEALGSELIQPSSGIEGVLKSEFQKGSMCAFLLCLDLPSVIMSAMKPTADEE